MTVLHTLERRQKQPRMLAVIVSLFVLAPLVGALGLQVFKALIWSLGLISITKAPWISVFGAVFSFSLVLLWGAIVVHLFEGFCFLWGIPPKMIRRQTLPLARAHYRKSPLKFSRLSTLGESSTTLKSK